MLVQTHQYCHIRFEAVMIRRVFKVGMLKHGIMVQCEARSRKQEGQQLAGETL